MGLLLGQVQTITQEEWDRRFKFAIDQSSNANHAGYSPDRPFIPPLQNPQTLAAIEERHTMLIQTGEIWNGEFWFLMLPFMIFWNGLGSGDSFDMYWYNNAFAEGEQTYP